LEFIHDNNHKFIYDFKVLKKFTKYILPIFYGILFFCNKTHAQKLNNDSTTIQLSEVKVIAISPDRFMSGLKIEKIDSATLAISQFRTLADFLQYQSPISIKSYGAGQLATISFRGTSANHTSLLWNGININSPSLGQTDFSTIPVNGFDQISIQYGSSASCVGTDAIGGSILLNSSPQFNLKNNSWSGAWQDGSFKNYQGQTAWKFNKTFKTGNQLSGKTQFYGNFWNNQFPYTKRSDWEGNVYPVQLSQTYQKGFTQDFFYKIKNGNLFSLNVWLADNNLTLNPNSISKEITQTNAYRFLGNYQIKNFLIKTGFIQDIIKYGKGDLPNPSKTITDKYILRLEYEYIPNFKNDFFQLNSKIGGEGTHYKANVDGYVNQDSTRENRLDLYTLTRLIIKKDLSISLNLRQAFSKNYKVPFTPSAGISYNLNIVKYFQFAFKGNISKSYRLPTLNERYWRGLGDPNIKPEDGFNKEAGIEISFKNERIQIKLGGTYYNNLINNWVYWNPKKNYHVENLQQVLIKGKEINFSFKYSVSNFSTGLTAIYAYTNSSQQKKYDETAGDIIGKQMIYVPLHTANANLFFIWKSWHLNLQGLYNSERYITFDHSGDPFPPYYIFNESISKTFKAKDKIFNLMFQVNNITNTTYPNVLKNAMPGTSMNLSFSFNISN